MQEFMLRGKLPKQLLLLGTVCLNLLVMSQLSGLAEVASPFRKVIHRLKYQTPVPILLPTKLPKTLEKTYATAAGDPEGYIIYLGKTLTCKGTTTCTIGYFTARQGKHSDFGEPIRLKKNIVGYYTPQRCSSRVCYPASINWMYRDAMYGIAAMEDKSIIVDMANSAIVAGYH